MTPKDKSIPTGWSHVAAVAAFELVMPYEAHPPAKVNAARKRLIRALMALANGLEAARDARPRPWRKGIEPTAAEMRDTTAACDAFHKACGLDVATARMLAVYLMVKSGELGMAYALERDGRKFRARLMRAQRARKPK